MPRYHNINGNKVQFTAAEETARDNEETAVANAAPARALTELRRKRDSLLHLTHLTELVACCVAYMEDNPNFYEVMEDFLQTPDEDGVSIEYDNKIENSISKIEGNVVTLSFKSNTKGSA